MTEILKVIIHYDNNIHVLLHIQIKSSIKAYYTQLVNLEFPHRYHYNQVLRSNPNAVDSSLLPFNITWLKYLLVPMKIIC